MTHIAQLLWECKKYIFEFWASSGHIVLSLETKIFNFSRKEQALETRRVHRIPHRLLIFQINKHERS